MGFSVTDVLESLAAGQDLPPDVVEVAFSLLMEGELSPAQAGAFLMGLRAKGETAQELAAGVSAALSKARLVPGLSGPRIDTCGTGGDASCSFNCSTAVALYLAGMGYQVVKHGNRAVSSSCGSADAVEALALPMLLEPEQVAEEVEKRNFAFLFAPNYHPAFKHIMPVRKDLGMRTLFNLMGPLLNPARPTHQLLGVAKAEIMQIMAEALRLGGVERAAVVHGAAGFDELSPFGPSKVVWISRGETVETELDPAELGIAPCDPEDVAVRDKDHALAVLRDVLAGTGPEAMQEMLVFNLAVALHLLEEEPLGTCVEQARDAVAQGAGMRPLG